MRFFNTVKLNCNFEKFFDQVGFLWRSRLSRCSKHIFKVLLILKGGEFKFAAMISKTFFEGKKLGIFCFFLHTQLLLQQLLLLY